MNATATPRAVLDDACRACGLHAGCRSPFMCGSGCQNQGCLLVVGEAPGDVEDSEGEAFVGRAGKLLRSRLKKAGIEPSICRFTNAVRCRPPNNKLHGVKAINHCKKFLHEEIEEMRPSYILVLGNTPLRSVLGLSGITNRRRTVFTYTLADGTEIPVVAAFHPAYILRNMDMMDDFEGDLRFLKNCMGGKIKGFDDVVVNPTPTVLQIKAFHKKVLRTGAPVAYDVEATTGRPLSDHLDFALLCVGVSDGDETLVLGIDDYDMANHRRMPMQFKSETERKQWLDAVRAMGALMRDARVPKLAHNERYDNNVLHRRMHWDVGGVHCDTLLLHAFVKALGYGHGLDEVGAELLGRGKYKHMIQPFVGEGTNPERFATIPRDVLHRYNGLDCWVTARIYPLLARKLASMTQAYEKDSARYRMNTGISPSQMFKHVMKAHRHFLRIERIGFCVDAEYAKSLLSQYQSEEALALKDMRNAPSVKQFVRDKRKAVVKEYRERNAVARANGARRRKTYTEEEIKALAMKEVFNPASPLDVSTVLHDARYMGMPVMKHTENENPSIDKEALALLQAAHNKSTEAEEFIKALLQYRLASKYIGTYINGTLEKCDPNNIAHAVFNLSGARTGRLSCKDPNLQNQPRDLALRRMFVPHAGRRLCKADYSQIELRVLAVQSGDPVMCDIYRTGRDLHTETARRVFGIPDDQEVPKELRTNAKAVNFGIVYGESAMGLAESLGITAEEAEQLIDAVLETFGVMNRWRYAQMDFAKKHGYVWTMTGRKRPLENAKITNEDQHSRSLRQHALRQAVNTPIQGAASDICVFALCAIADAFEEARTKEGRDVELVSIVHDEIIWEAALADWKWSANVVRRCMLTAMFQFINKKYWGDVPLDIDMSTSAQSWGDMQAVRFKPATTQ